MSGLLPVAGLRFREAIAGRMLWLLPIHFLLAFAAAKAMPGTTADARIEAADATALAMAGVLGLVAAVVIGAGPLATERLEPRGALLLGAPISPLARVLGTFLGSGAALLLLVAALAASAMAAVDLTAGVRVDPPVAFERARSITGGEPDPREKGLVWLTKSNNCVEIRIGLRDDQSNGHQGPLDRLVSMLLGGSSNSRDWILESKSRLVVETQVRVGSDGSTPGTKEAMFRFCDDYSRHPGIPFSRFGDFSVQPTPAGLSEPFRIMTPFRCDFVELHRIDSNFDLGLRTEGVRLVVGPRPRAVARGLHAAALGAGLLAALAVAMALSTVVGTGVAAAGALALAMLSLFRTTFVEAARDLSSAGAMERAMEVAGGGHAHAEAGMPPALAPFFRAVAALLPDGSRFDLAQAVAANEVPDTGDVGRAALLGATLAVLFLGAALLGARRRP